MPRNFDRRVELWFPIEVTALSRRAEEILEIYWRDNTHARRLNADGRYEFLSPGADERSFDAQQMLLPEPMTRA